MRENNNFNQLIYPAGLNDEQKEAYAATGMDHRVGVNEDLVDAEPYNAKKTDLKHASVELIEDANGEWKRFDADKARYDLEATAITTAATKTIMVNEEYKPEITVTPDYANIPALTWYITAQTPSDNTSDGPVVAITSDGVIRGIQPGTASVTGKVSEDDKPNNNLYVEVTITVS